MSSNQVERHIEEKVDRAIEYLNGDHPWADNGHKAPWEGDQDEFDTLEEVVSYIVAHNEPELPNEPWEVIQYLSGSEDPISDRVAGYLQDVGRIQDVPAETVVYVMAREQLTAEIIDRTLEQVQT